jgi:TetR/AcrR family transcriptional regulator
LATVSVRFSSADRRVQILDVATGIFARQGFQGATTREIAQRAGVTEALVFRHFRTKEVLYWAVIERKIIAAAGAERMRALLSSGMDDRQVLSAVAAQILEHRAKDETLSRLLIYSALESHDLSGRFFRKYVAECFEILADFIRKRISEGRFIRVNPVLAARGFLGMVVYHSWIQELYGGKRYQDFSVKEVSETFADLWLQGMIKAGENASKSPAALLRNGNRRRQQYARRKN